MTILAFTPLFFKKKGEFLQKNGTFYISIYIYITLNMYFRFHIKIAWNKIHNLITIMFLKKCQSKLVGNIRCPTFGNTSNHMCHNCNAANF